MLYKVVDKKYKSPMAFGKYRLSYNIGSIVTAVPNTLGIMLFDELIDVDRFITNFEGSLFDCCRILTVEAKGKITIPEKVGLCVDERSINFFYENLYISVSPPTGTVCCQSIKILGEINLGHSCCL